jgi:hypothetical protein
MTPNFGGKCTWPDSEAMVRRIAPESTGSRDQYMVGQQRLRSPRSTCPRQRFGIRRALRPLWNRPHLFSLTQGEISYVIAFEKPPPCLRLFRNSTFPFSPLPIPQPSSLRSQIIQRPLSHSPNAGVVLSALQRPMEIQGDRLIELPPSLIVYTSLCTTSYASMGCR